ncbi:MAG: DMT family transporter, partial [Phycisphaerales bacterium]|nr:DMT family transporter [Phycisphaerales bacterium]
MADWIVTYRGEGAALLTAWCWVLTSLVFAAAGRRVGPTIVNVTRLFLAVALLGCLNRMTTGGWIPSVDPISMLLLMASGIIGLSIGDQLLFTALVDVGSRMSTLLMTLAPPIVALSAWMFLGENITLMMLVGMTITLGGIMLVIRERPSGDDYVPHPHRRRGIIFGVLAAWCQGFGFVLAKLGMGHARGEETVHIDPLAATLIRMAFAAVGMALIAMVWSFIRARLAVRTPNLTPKRRRIGSAIPFIILGTVFGPVLGVWLSLIAVDASKAGVAATLMAMTPVFILPFAFLVERERITWRAVIGALIAVAGVAWLTVADS